MSGWDDTGRWDGLGPWDQGGSILAIGRWQPDTVELIAQDTPTLYVKWDAAGTGDGSSWTNAYTTIIGAYTAASNDDVISISGGASGHTYGENLATLSKTTTLQGSTETGHDGLVTVEGGLYINIATGTATLNNFKVAKENHTTYTLRFHGAGNIVHNNMTYGISSTATVTSCFYEAGNHTFNYTTFFRTGYKVSISDPRFFTVQAAVDAMTFNYCTFGGSGYTVLPTGVSWTMNNCLVLPHAYTNYFLDIGNSASTAVNINRTAFYGVQPVMSGALSVLNVDRCYWTKEPGVTGVASNSPYFDSSNIATITDTIENVNPMYTTPRNTTIGQFFLRYDDRNNLGVAITTASTLNPEIILTESVDLHGRNSETRPSAQNIDDMRTLISNDNEINSHGADHSDNQDLGTINISATGTTPTLDIVATQAGDSTTWANTLTVTINGTPLALDLMSASYDTLGELITALNGVGVGDGTITAAISNTNNKDHTFSGMLEVTTGQSISSTHEISFDRTAYNRYEITEAIADLNFYINDATDRNGANAVAGTSVPAPSPDYVCKGYVSPYGRGDASIVTLLQADANILCAQQANSSTVNDSDYYARGVDQNVYTNRYVQMITGTQSDDLFGLAAAASAGPYVYFALYHGDTPEYNGSLANFKAMLIALDVGDQTMSEYFDYIRTDGAWTISEPNASFTGTADDYLSQGDYSLQVGSPLFYTE